MTSLTFLDLSDNYFNHSGTHDLLGLMKKLTHLNLANIWIDEKVDWISEFLGDTCHLKSLDLGENRIYGDISGVFKNMSCHNLESLSLGHNLIYGELPQNLGDQLQYLIHLDLSHNLLHGPIPKLLGNLSVLTYLDLSSNNFSVPIPTPLGKFSALTYLDLSSNNFSGLIPTLLGNFSSLTYLDLSLNNFSGPFPSWFSNLTSLRVLDLSENQLSGEIPISMGQLSDLESIDISFNGLETTLSEAHFAKLSKLQVLHASFNKMIRFRVGYDWVPPFQLVELLLTSSKMGEGAQFPQWLKNQKALIDLDMSNCSMTGSLPTWLQSMNSLGELDLSHNNISGPLPLLSSMNSLRSLDVSHNNISGSIPELSSSTMLDLDLSDNMITHLPTNIGHMLPHLQYLNLARNLTSGSIPDSLCRIKELEHLHLSNNHLSGNLPDCWPSLSNLLVVRLSYNELTGAIPKSIGGANNLISLQLDGNSLTGQIPSTLKNCTRLELVDVGGNNLSGNLPEWIGKHLLDLKFLRLQNNDFFGTIPLEFFRSMTIEASLPYTFYRLLPMSGSLISEVMKGVELEYSTNLKYLVNLDLSSNHLVGEIPWELTNLSSLIGLNLSHNHLRGEIPAEIGDMKSLESLDLSNNYLWGIIPATLSKLSFLSQLNLSNYNLSGQIPTGRQLQTLDDPWIYEGNPQLCGAPLQRKCVNGEVAAGVVDNEAGDDEGRADRIWFYGIITAGFAMGFWAVIGGMVVKTKWRRTYFRYIEVAVAKMLGYLLSQRFSN
ncbi:hypothetical protein C2S53_008406 [Perilla frutescens var. hirtella]|uniref:Disease resistance R13L4/SHOC-2-like LRR domain-containing protein n=1 Tax=Perilla frutescens var. hirtella TaxID=608512 RepID=A0AAD4IS13_PERFH|nr:hypothetical protein C2S53_008406 [Perilla frutescens var. hirtella]